MGCAASNFVPDGTYGLYKLHIWKRGEGGDFSEDYPVLMGIKVDNGEFACDDGFVPVRSWIRGFVEKLPGKPAQITTPSGDYVVAGSPMEITLTSVGGASGGDGGSILLRGVTDQQVQRGYSCHEEADNADNGENAKKERNEFEASCSVCFPLQIPTPSKETPSKEKVSSTTTGAVVSGAWS